MKRFLLLLVLHSSLLSLHSTLAQTRMRDIYAAAPDSIFPLLTKNNRLDQIDVCEYRTRLTEAKNMQAVVKNRFDKHSELLILTDRYLKLQLSEHCLVEMRLLCDSTLASPSDTDLRFCMVETFNAPAPDSRIRFFDAQWHELPQSIARPSVDEFLSDDIDIDVRLALQALPLIKASLSEDDDTITFELQTSELTREQRQKAEGKTHVVVIKN